MHRQQGKEVRQGQQKESYQTLVNEITTVQTTLERAHDQLRTKKTSEGANPVAVFIALFVCCGSIGLFFLAIFVPHTQRNWDNFKNATQNSVNAASDQLQWSRDQASRLLHVGCGLAANWRAQHPYMQEKRAARRNRTKNPLRFFVDLGGKTGAGIDWLQQNRSDAEEFVIHTFEAGSEAASRLREYKKQHGFLNITVHEKVVWTEDGNTVLYRGGGRLGVTVVKRHESQQQFEADAIDIVQWLEDTVYSADFVIVKMDIGASEYPILKKLLITKKALLIDLLLVKWHDNNQPKYFQCTQCSKPPNDTLGRPFLNSHQCQKKVYSKVLGSMLQLEDWKTDIWSDW